MRGGRGRYSKENFPNILKLADGLKKIGERRGATAGQVSLAWLLGQGEDVIPIPGTTKVKVRTAVSWPSGCESTLLTESGGPSTLKRTSARCTSS